MLVSAAEEKIFLGLLRVHQRRIFRNRQCLLSAYSVDGRFTFVVLFEPDAQPGLPGTIGANENEAASTLESDLIAARRPAWENDVHVSAV